MIECFYCYSSGVVLHLIATRWQQFGLRVWSFVAGQCLPFTVSIEDASLLGASAVSCLFDIAKNEFELWQLRGRDGVVSLAIS